MPKDSKSEHLLKEKSGSPSYPVFGRANILTTLKHFDRKLNHQGIKPIIEELEKEKIIFFDRSQDDNFSLFPVNKENLTEIYQCNECKTVLDLKGRGLPKRESKTIIYNLTNGKDIEEALIFADDFHTGFI